MGEGEGEGEGCSPRVAPHGGLEPLTLSPLPLAKGRGERNTMRLTSGEHHRILA